jgi:hyaluronan synthase
VFVFLLQVRDTLENHRIYLFTIFIALVWIVWLRKVQLSRRYRPVTTPYAASTSVVISGGSWRRSPTRSSS